MKLTQVSSSCDFRSDTMTINIDKVLHLLIKRGEVNGIQSWLEDTYPYLIKRKRIYKIEISFRTGQPVLVEYKSRKLWEAILRCLRGGIVENIQYIQEDGLED